MAASAPEETPVAVVDGSADELVARKLDIADVDAPLELDEKVDAGAEWERLRALAAPTGQVAASAAMAETDSRGEKAKRFSAPSTLLANWVQGVTSNIEKSIGRGSAAVRSSYPAQPRAAGPAAAIPTSAKELARHSTPAMPAHFLLEQDLAGGSQGGDGVAFDASGTVACARAGAARGEGAGIAADAAARNWLGEAGKTSGGGGGGGGVAGTDDQQPAVNRGCSQPPSVPPSLRPSLPPSLPPPPPGLCSFEGSCRAIPAV